jgi:hypothetical protein
VLLQQNLEEKVDQEEKQEIGYGSYLMTTTHNRLLLLEDWQAKCFAKEVQRLSREQYGI